MSDIRIVIAQRGFVFIGRYAREDLEIVLRDAYFVHRWGTTQGLGEIAPGPTPQTVLHKTGTVRLHPLQILATIDTDAPGWAEHFPE